MVPISLSIYCSRLMTVAFNLNVVLCSVSEWLTSSLVVSQLAVVLFLPWGLSGISVCPLHQDLLSTLFVMNWCHQHTEGAYLFVPSFFKIKGSFFVYLNTVTLSSLIELLLAFIPRSAWDNAVWRCSDGENVQLEKVTGTFLEEAPVLQFWKIIVQFIAREWKVNHWGCLYNKQIVIFRV